MLKEYDKEQLITKIGISNPEAVTTKQAAAYLSEAKGIKIAVPTLEAHRSRNRGCRFKRVGRRIFYTIAWLDEYAAGEVIDPAQGQKES